MALSGFQLSEDIEKATEEGTVYSVSKFQKLTWFRVGSTSDIVERLFSLAEHVFANYDIKIISMIL